MVTKYYCDICKQETEHHKNADVTGERFTVYVDLCVSCLTKYTVEKLMKLIIASKDVIENITEITIQLPAREETP